MSNLSLAATGSYLSLPCGVSQRTRSSSACTGNTSGDSDASCRPRTNTDPENMEKPRFCKLIHPPSSLKILFESLKVSKLFCVCKCTVMFRWLFGMRISRPISWPISWRDRSCWTACFLPLVSSPCFLPLFLLSPLFPPVPCPLSPCPCPLPLLVLSCPVH